MALQWWVEVSEGALGEDWVSELALGLGEALVLELAWELAFVSVLG
jgi:hypothetical protein